MGDVKLALCMGFFLGAAVIPALFIGFIAGALAGDRAPRAADAAARRPSPSAHSWRSAPSSGSSAAISSCTCTCASPCTPRQGPRLRAGAPPVAARRQAAGDAPSSARSNERERRAVARRPRDAPPTTGSIDGPAHRRVRCSCGLSNVHEAHATRSHHVRAPRRPRRRGHARRRRGARPRLGRGQNGGQSRRATSGPGAAARAGARGGHARHGQRAARRARAGATSASRPAAPSRTDRRKRRVSRPLRHQLPRRRRRVPRRGSGPARCPASPRAGSFTFACHGAQSSVVLQMGGRIRWG